MNQSIKMFFGFKSGNILLIKQSHNILNKLLINEGINHIYIYCFVLNQSMLFTHEINI